MDKAQIEKQQKFLIETNKLLENLNKSFQALSDHWLNDSDNNTDLNLYLTQKFPFNESFEVFCRDVSYWVENGTNGIEKAIKHLQDVKNTCIPEEVFWNEYKPIICKVSDGEAPFDGCMFETYGLELSLVLDHYAAKPKTVWTITEEDGITTIRAGMNIVNRLGFLITEKEWNTIEDYVENN